MEAVKTRLGKVEKEFEEKAQVADEKLKARQDEGDRVVENDVVMMKETLSMLEDMGVVKSKVENEMKLAGTRVTEELARMESAMNAGRDPHREGKLLERKRERSSKGD